MDSRCESPSGRVSKPLHHLNALKKPQPYQPLTQNFTRETLPTVTAQPHLPAVAKSARDRSEKSTILPENHKNGSGHD